MFTDPNPWHLKSTLKMPPRCTECGQLFELEVGFWYGTAYLSYAITVLFLRDQFFSLVPDNRILTDRSAVLLVDGYEWRFISCTATLVHATEPGDVPVFFCFL